MVYILEIAWEQEEKEVQYFRNFENACEYAEEQMKMGAFCGLTLKTIFTKD